MADTFSPNPAPLFSFEDAREPRVLRPPFGDGYGLRVQDGINANRAKITLRWEGLSLLEAEEIFDFFEAQGGYKAFLYQPPLFNVARKWCCGKYERKLTDPDSVDIQAELEQVFDLG